MEEIGLEIIFQEIKVRGSDDLECVVRAIENGNGCSVEDIISYSSWEELKAEFPTLESILEDFFKSPNWDPSWRGGDRMLFIESIKGHEGLYEFDPEKMVFVEWENNEEEEEDEE